VGKFVSYDTRLLLTVWSLAENVGIEVSRFSRQAAEDIHANFSAAVVLKLSLFTVTVL